MSRYSRIALIASIATITSLLGIRPAAAEETGYFSFDYAPISYNPWVYQSGTITLQPSGGYLDRYPGFIFLNQTYLHGGPVDLVFNKPIRYFDADFGLTFVDFGITPDTLHVELYLGADRIATGSVRGQVFPGYPPLGIPPGRLPEGSLTLSQYVFDRIHLSSNAGFLAVDNISVTAVGVSPEPATLPLLLMGAVGTAGYLWRKRV